MAGTRRVTVPEQTSIATSLLQNPIRQLAATVATLDGTGQRWERRGTVGEHFTAADGRTILLAPKRVRPPAGVDAVLVVADSALLGLPDDGFAEIDARQGKWTFPSLNAEQPADEDGWRARRRLAQDSWRARLEFREERRDAQGNIAVRGFRTPQIGALHAILAHWTVTIDPATVVMPTGTGKTETMLSALLSVQPECLLVIVPTDVLRDQVSRKFLSLGVLPVLGVLNGELTTPVVGTLRKRPKSPAEVRAFFSRCNVIVTTMAVAGTCLPDVQKEMAAVASHLIIDEAHHISARTWAYFRSNFVGKPILQFTATPFRRDRKHVDGRIIYNYPLRKAQDEGLFQRVNFTPVFEYGEIADADAAIASRALAQLDADLTAKLDHLALARGDTIARAIDIYDAYLRLEKQRVMAGQQAVGVVLVHSGLTRTERQSAMERLRSRRARVVVCVDMFGEGFDMPELKIAALHDVHKSLAVTLQFVGRFTRAVASLGEATVVVNLGRTDVEDSLRALYAEDADWNVVLRDLSTGASNRQVRRADFLKRFEPPPTTIPLQNLSPAMSTVVYRVTCEDWRPDLISDAIGDDRLYGMPSINHTEHVAVFVTREVDEVEWGDIREIADTTWDLYIVHWDSAEQLLYICSSNNRSLHGVLAEAICGDDALLLKGEAMFRVFHNVRRLVLLNLGLRHAIGRNIQFTMYVGADVLENLPGAAQTNKIKSNMFGHGYEEGQRASYGCSYKGRVWSHRRAGDLVEWMEWAHEVGRKISDTSIDTAAALKFALIPKRATTRPAAVPFAVQWPHELLMRDEDVITFDFGSERASLLHVGLDIDSHSADGPLTLRVFTESVSATYEVTFSDAGVDYVHRAGSAVTVKLGRQVMGLDELFRDGEPPIYFVDGSSLRGDALLLLPKDYVPPFLRERIEVLDWTGVNIKKESQGLSRDSDSIQRRIIENLMAPSSAPDPDIVFDDDASGESADVVTLRVAGERLFIQLFHCKFSSDPKPGARVDDLYQVCGQAQKSAYWKGIVDRLLAHIDRRESDRMKRGGPTRFAKGDVLSLRALRRRADALEPSLEIIVVQPGLSKEKASDDQLELLGVTELYLQETYRIPLRIIGSA